MRVSCIIPTRNREELVCRAIASVLAQKVPVAELIVVDDGSTDSTAELIARSFSDCRVVTLPGHGPGPARNAGAEAATGDVLMFLDSDDVWLSDHVSALVQTLSRGYSVAYGVTLTIDQVSGGEFLIPEQGQGREGQCLEFLARWCFLVPSSFAVRREAFSASGGFPACGFGEDWAFFVRIAGLYPFGFCGQQPITLRYLHAGSLCNGAGAERIAQALDGVSQALAASGASLSALAGFAEIVSWTREQGTDWQTIQEWYVSLQQEDLV